MGLKYFILGILFTLLILGAGFGIYTIGKSQSGPAGVSPLIQPTLSVQKDADQPFSDVIAPKPTSSPKIAIDDSGGGVSDADKNQIIQKVISPYLDYYKDAGQGKLVSLIISLNTKPNNVDYPFLAAAEFDTGVKNSFVIKRIGQDLSWWFPECMGPCLLTDEFRSKYPEIVKLVE